MLYLLWVVFLQKFIEFITIFCLSVYLTFPFYLDLNFTSNTHTSQMHTWTNEYLFVFVLKQTWYLTVLLIFCDIDKVFVTTKVKLYQMNLIWNKRNKCSSLYLCTYLNESAWNKVYRYYLSCQIGFMCGSLE